MARFFNPEKGIWPFFGVFADLLILSMLWTVCAAPVITAGAAGAALYDAVSAGLKKKEQNVVLRFFETLRREFKGSLLPTLLWALILGGLWRVFSRLGAGLPLMAAAALFVVLVLLPLGVCCWVFPLLSRFTLDFRTLNLNALRLALGHVLQTLGAALSAALAVWLTLRLALLPLFLLPALLALCHAALMEPVFRQYEAGTEE